jgi:hypothetical protein
MNPPNPLMCSQNQIVINICYALKLNPTYIKYETTEGLVLSLENPSYLRDGASPNMKYMSKGEDEDIREFFGTFK